MDTLIIFGGAALIMIIGLFLLRRPVTEDEVWYDENEVLPAPPQPWGRDDYRP